MVDFFCDSSPVFFFLAVFRRAAPFHRFCDFSLIAFFSAASVAALGFTASFALATAAEGFLPAQTNPKHAG